jgi:hypothetical protein
MVMAEIAQTNPGEVRVCGLEEKQGQAMKGLFLTLSYCCLNNVPFGESLAVAQFQWQLRKDQALARLNNWLLLRVLYTPEETRECFRQWLAILREDGRFSHMIIEVRGAFPDETRGLCDD